MSLALLESLTVPNSEQTWSGAIDDPDGVWLIRQGGVEEWRRDVKLAWRHSGDPEHALLGALDALWTKGPGRTRVAERWFAEEQTQVARIDVDRLRQILTAGGPDAETLQTLLLEYGRQWRTDAGHTFDSFAWARWHGTSAHPYPPPIDLAGSELFVVPCLAPRSLQDDLPPGIWSVPVDDDEDQVRAVLLFRRTATLRPETDRPPGRPEGGLTQAILALPVSVGLKGPKEAWQTEFGLYVVWAFGNNALTSFIVRETFGLPAMYGNTYRVQDESVPAEARNHWRLIGSAGGTRAFDLQFERPEPGTQLTDDDAKALVDSLGPVVRTSETKLALSPMEKDLMARVKSLAAGTDPKPAGPLVLPGLFGAELVGWKRLFSANAEAASRVAWRTEDFNVDGLAVSYLAADAFTEVDVVRVREKSSELFLSSQNGQQPFQLLNGYALRLVGDFKKLSRLGDEEPELALDYKALDAEGKLTPPMKERLAWGPAVWGDEFTLPPSGVTHTPPPRFRLVADRIRRSPLAALKRGWWDTSDEVRGGLADLLDALRRALGSDLVVEKHRAGTILTRPNDQQQDVYWLLDGLVDLWRGNQFAGYVEPGELLGQFIPHPRGIGVEARVGRDCRLLVIPNTVWRRFMAAPNPSPARQHLHDLERRTYVIATLMAVHSLTQATYQFFPGAQGQVLPGPYSAAPVDQFTIPLQRTKWLEALLPPRITWAAGRPALLVFARFEGFKSTQIEVDGGARYSECGLMIPVRVEGAEGVSLFIPWIFPTSVMAAFAGREIYGYPKSWGTVLVDPVQRRLVLRRSGTTMLDISWKSIPGSRLRGGMSSVYGRLYKHLPELLKASLTVACHQRTYAANASVTDPADLAAYSSDLFAIDAVVASEFVVDTLQSADVVRLDRLTISCRVPTGVGGEPTVVPLRTFGVAVHVTYGVKMTVPRHGASLLDYKNGTRDGNDGSEVVPLGLDASERDLLSIARRQALDAAQDF